MHTNHQRTVNRVAAIIEAERRHARIPTAHKPEVFDPYMPDMNTEVGPVSGHEYRSMKDGPLANAVKWSARGLLAVVVTGWLVVVFLMLQQK